MSLRIDLTKLRNVVVNGVVGTVDYANSLNPTVAVSDIVKHFLGAGAVGAKIMLTMRYTISPANASQVAVKAATNLGAAIATVYASAQPDVARLLQVKGNVSGVAGNVVITGRDNAGTVITDTIALSGASAVEGTKAFALVSGIQLPVQTHTPIPQKETATGVGTITKNGNAVVVVTAAGMTNSPKTLSVAVANNDLPAAWMAKVRAALLADVDVAAFFSIGVLTGAALPLTALTPAANDGTMNISLDNDTCTGITTAASSANTTAGVGYDTVSVGYTNKFGLPHVVAAAGDLSTATFDGSTDAGSLVVDTALSKNIYTIAGTPNGAKKLVLTYSV